MAALPLQTRARVGLGTVQLGLPYGNQAHAPLMSEAQAREILQAAVDAKVLFFDTAIAYGESESRLGRFELAAKSPQATISTKIPAAPESLWRHENSYWTWLVEQIQASRGRLGLSSHDLLQFHQCDLAFLTAAHIRKSLQRLVDEGYCQRVGISVYYPEQAEAALDLPAVKALQIPANLLDDRFLQPEFLAKTRAERTLLIVRSALMQGVLIDSAPLPQVKRADKLKQLRSLAQVAAAGSSLQSLTLRYLFCNHSEDLGVVLLGIDSPISLRQNLELIDKARESLSLSDLQAFHEARQFALTHELVNPGLWNT